MKIQNSQLLDRKKRGKLFYLIVINIGLAIAYDLASQISLRVTLFNSASALWLPSGITLALVMILGPQKVLPGIIIGSFAGMQFSGALNEITSLINIIIIHIGCILANYLQPLLTTSIIKKYHQLPTVFTTINGTIIFILASFFSPLLTSTILVNVSVYTGLYPIENYQNSFFTMWIASGLAHLIFTPLFLLKYMRAVPGSQQISPRHKLLITIFILVSTIVIFWLIFIKNYSIEYTFLLLLIVTVFTLGKKVSIVMVAIISSVAIIATTWGIGPFVQTSNNQSLLLLQSFIGVFAVTALILSAIIDEKQRMTNQLESTLANLENIVKERTAELLIAKEKAEIANQTKSTFIANMSHELRSPLNAILGFAQVILRTKNLPKEEYENASIIYRSGEYLLNLINNILDFAKIEAGKTTFNPKNFDFHQLLNDLEDMLHLRAQNKGLELNFAWDRQLPRFIVTDEIKLRQVLLNLLGNGIKFTEVGGVRLAVTLVDIDHSISSHNFHNDYGQNSQEKYILNFMISDTGSGIAAPELDKLFQAFSQTIAGRNAQEGTGLGLVISQQFVHLMGGKIQVNSELGRGATFQFTIPVQAGQPIIQNHQSESRQVLGLQPHQPVYKIMIVDDKALNRQLLIKLLQPMGFQLKEASNGQEAIALWESWHPHLIFMDMRMPVMDGYEATKYIKSHVKGNATAIIALTASVFEEEKALILSAGCDDFVRKPFRESTIFDMLHKHLGVKFIYQEKDTDITADLEEITLTTDALQVMPKSWLSQLASTVLEADNQKVLQLIAEIPASEELLRNILIKLAKQFQYEKILNLIEPLIDNE